MRKNDPFRKFVAEHQEHLKQAPPGGHTFQQSIEMGISSLEDPAVGRAAWDKSLAVRLQRAKEKGEADDGVSLGDYKQAYTAKMHELSSDIRRAMGEVTRKDAKTKAQSFRSMWYEDEPDADLIQPEKPEDDRFQGNDITSMAHAKLDEIREQRQYYRTTVWEMPLLASE